MSRYTIIQAQNYENGKFDLQLLDLRTGEKIFVGGCQPLIIDFDSNNHYTVELLPDLFRYENVNKNKSDLPKRKESADWESGCPYCDTVGQKICNTALEAKECQDNWKESIGL